MNETMQAVAQAATGPGSEGFNWDSAFPALIGFTGVLFGGLINVAAQRRNFNEEQVAKVRERVAELCVLVHELTGSAKQAHDTLLRKGQKTSDLGVITLDGNGNAIFNVIAENYFRLYREANSLSIRLMSARDRKIASHAADVQSRLSNFSHDNRDLFDYKLTVSTYALDSDCEKLMMVCNEMLTMIEPRFYESFWRIRTTRTASNSLDKHVKRQNERLKDNAEQP